MKYKLIENSLNDIHNPIKTVLQNRGIQDVDTYMHLNDNVINDYHLLENIDKAVECLINHIENNSKIQIIVDPDVDGNTSSAILYMYLKQLDCNININYIIHQHKEHGLSKDIKIDRNTDLIILPDSGTNDVEQCKELKENGKDIIILDHHICDRSEPYTTDYYAIVVNNQMCEYPNKELSGVGIVYKFLKAIDDYTWSNYADNYLDLVALGNIADVMDIKSYETKKLIDIGLYNINNKLLQAFIDKQSYSMGNTVNIINLQFYVIPLINALIRIGTYDEKELLFKAFIEYDELFKYKPRKKHKEDAETEEINETIYEHVVRIANNVKSKQNLIKVKSINKIDESIEKYGFDKNKIIFVNVSNLLDTSMTGVVASNIASKYNKPCLLLRKEKSNEHIYSGSGRNVNGSPIENLKQFLDNTNMFEYVSGHDNAFGVSIKKDNIGNAINYINKKLQNIDFSFVYKVDFIINASDLSIGFINDMNKIRNIYGSGIEESLICISNIFIDKTDINIFGKENNILKFKLNDEIEFIKFKITNDECLQKWINNDNIKYGYFDVIGKASINTYKGFKTPQIIIQDLEILG